MLASGVVHLVPLFQQNLFQATPFTPNVTPATAQPLLSAGEEKLILPSREWQEIAEKQTM